MSVITKRNKWKNKKSRVSYKINRSLKYPKIIIFRSNKNISVQVIDHKSNSTICSSSSLDKDLKKKAGGKTGNIETATAVGSDLAKKAKEKGIKEVYFDRGGYLYHGRVKALAEAARKEGLKF